MGKLELISQCLGLELFFDFAERGGREGEGQINFVADTDFGDELFWRRPVDERQLLKHSCVEALADFPVLGKWVLGKGGVAPILEDRG